MADPRTERNALLGATLVKKLQARAFDAYYCATKEEALQQALALIPKTDASSSANRHNMTHKTRLNCMPLRMLYQRDSLREVRSSCP